MTVSSDLPEDGVMQLQGAYADRPESKIGAVARGG